jgi:hypothetical protein
MATTLVVMVSEARRKQWWRNYYEPARSRCGCAAAIAPAAPSSWRRARRVPLDRRAARCAACPYMRRVFRVADYDRDAGCAPISSTGSARRSRS